MAENVITLAVTGHAVANQAAPNVNYSSANLTQELVWQWGQNNRKYLYFLLEALPAALQKKRLYQIRLCVYAEWSGSVFSAVNGAKNILDPGQCTWNTAPGLVYPAPVTGNAMIQPASGEAYYIPDTYDLSQASPEDRSLEARQWLINRTVVLSTDYASRLNSLQIYTELDPSYAPSVEVTYDTAEDVTSQVVQQNSITSGYLNPHIDQVFRWTLESADGYSRVAPFVVSSATLHYKDDGGWHTIGASGDVYEITLPANTFGATSAAQWYVEVTDQDGTTSQTPTYDISTAAPLLSAAPISPIGEVIDKTGDVTFRWSVSSTGGNDTIGADLQYSTDGSTWTNLGHKTSTEPEATVAASLLPLGAVYWRVRAYNIDNVVGAWSSAASFVVVGAPDAPSVTVEAVPFATIRWQGDGQQAYRITVDGSVYGPFFGDAKSYTLQDYLEDGAHTAAVELQGAYGLWSQPGEAQFEIQNVPGEPITLRGRMHIDAQLDWTGGSAAAEFLVYRDGRRIGRTRGAAFLDRLTLGTHDWQVIGRLADGNYTPSNVITGTLASCPPRIAPAAGGDWLELTMSENSSRAIETAESVPVSLRHFEGAEYPVAETTPYRDASIPFDVAWTYGQTDEARRFEALLAQPVIFKSGDGCVVGILSAYVRRSVRFYRSYSCTLQRIHWEDFVDDTDD